MGFGLMCARLRIPLGVTGIALLALSWIGPEWIAWAGMGWLGLGLVLYFRIGSVHRSEVEVESPAAGRR